MTCCMSNVFLLNLTYCLSSPPNDFHLLIISLMVGMLPCVYKSQAARSKAIHTKLISNVTTWALVKYYPTYHWGLAGYRICIIVITQYDICYIISILKCLKCSNWGFIVRNWSNVSSNLMSHVPGLSRIWLQEVFIGTGFILW